jgi:hypothetical protein
MFRAACFLLLASLARAEDLASWPAPRVLPLEARLYHVQGIDVDGDSLWITSVDRAARQGWLHLVDLKTGRLVREVAVQEGERYHPGGISLDADSVWIPVAEYHRGGKTSIQQRDRRTLALLSGFTVDDHIGCLAASRDALYGGNWDSLQIYTWSRSGAQRARRDNPAGTRYQDLKFLRGKLVGSGVRDAASGAIDWLDPVSLSLERRITAGKTDRGVRFNNEGMTIRAGKLYLLPEDGPSRLFVWDFRP